MEERKACRCLKPLLLVAAALGTAFAEDLVDTRQLGKRGAILETIIIPSQHGLKVWETQAVGDVNGDGLADLGVIYQGEPGPGETGPWRVAVVHGRRDLSGRHLLDELEGTAIFAISNPLVRDGCTGANHVHPVGDVNGDGLADFMVGFTCYRFTDDQVNNGAAFLIYGHRDLTGHFLIEDVGDTVPGVVFWSSDPTHDSVGFNYRRIGDFNGDGRDDLAISAITSDAGMFKKAGVLFVLFDIRDLPPRVDLARVGVDLPGMVLRGTTLLETPDGPVIRPLGFLGSGIEPAGDVNGDGFADFLLSAHDMFTVYLVRGSAHPPGVIDLGGLDEAGFRRLGITVFHDSFDHRIFADDHEMAGIGDVNGDGRSEIILGLSQGGPPGDPTTHNSEVYLFWGREDFPAVVDMADVPASLATVFRPFQWGDFFGDPVAPAGDLNGDGVPDFLIGAQISSRDGLSRVGEAYAIFSRPDFPPEVRLDEGFAGIRVLGEGIDQDLGASVSSAGDFNGDGALDIAISAPQVSNLEVDRGRVYVIYGSGSDRPPFTLLDVTPDFGSIRGGTPVVVRGSGFAGEVAVRFGERPALRVDLISTSEIHAVAPPAPAPGAVDVTVTVDGNSLRLERGFEYIEPLPQIDLANPGRRGFTILGDGKRRVGESMALGDLTGDGAAELVVALTAEEVQGTWSVGVLHGGTRQSGVVELSQPSAGLTLIDLSVTGNGGLAGMVGDVNGDGIGDLGLGADGAVGVILFGRREFPPALDLAAELASGRAAKLAFPGAFGRMQFAPAGDIDGDGIGDLAIGFPRSGETQNGGFPAAGDGQVVLVAGRRSWLGVIDLTKPEAVLGRLRGAPQEGLGVGLSSAGDVNGDGRPDLLASTQTPRRAYLIFGPEAPIGERLIGEYVESGGGVAFDLDVGPVGKFDAPHVSGPGDVDGDGLDDVLLGLTDSPGDLVGVSYLVRGARDLPRLLPVSSFPGAVAFLGPGTEAEAGFVGPAGDFNADGRADFLIGTGFSAQPGTVFLILGAPDFPKRVELATLRGRGIKIEGTIPSGLIEVHRETGDLDGDRVSDIALSERGLGSPQDVLGRVHVVFGVPKEAAFVRGDANFDGKVNISDAIFTLSFLFLGGPAPLCDDAADADDNGRLDITDAIRTLDALFLGTATLPAPYPEEGQDATQDSLRCLGF